MSFSWGRVDAGPGCMPGSAGTRGGQPRTRHLTCPDAQLVQRYPVRPGILSGQGNEPK